MSLVGWYSDRLLPRLTDRALRTPEVSAWRHEAVLGLRGTILEIGFGSGLNIPVYPPEVDRVLAVEPVVAEQSGGAGRIDTSPVRIEYIGTDAQALPLDDATVDGALSTFTLCTVPDPARALSEIHRVLKPGGQLSVVEHGHSPDPRVARWQRRLEPFQKRLAGGCHLTRDALAMIRSAGFAVDYTRSAYASGPRPWTWFTVVRAHR